MKRMRFILGVLFMLLINVGLIYSWGSEDKYVALYAVTIMTIDIMLSPLAIILIFCLIYGSGFLEKQD